MREKPKPIRYLFSLSDFRFLIATGMHLLRAHFVFIIDKFQQYTVHF